MNKRLWILLMICGALLVACQDDSQPLPTTAAIVTPIEGGDGTQENGGEETAVLPTEPPEVEVTVTPTPPPTATPLPAKTLTICTAQLPQNLYLYGDQSDVAQMIRQAIFEPLYSTLGYDYQPIGLATFPDIEAGDAEINTVLVQTGDRVVDGSGSPVTLQSGVQVENAVGELITYDGGDPIEMVQMTATFGFAPLVWADGTPVTAVDSVYSFNVAADLITPADKTVIERTAVYESQDDNTAVWVGLPGYIDRTYFLNVWTPLPSHQLTRFTANELLEAPETNQTPLGYGPFVVQSWEADRLILTRNPNYYRTDISAVGELDFVLSEDGFGDIMNGRCQIALSNSTNIEQTPDILTAVDDVTPIFRQSLVFEHIDFGINPVPNYQRNHPDWFEIRSLRRAFMHCIDRQRMIDELQFGQGVLHDAYVSSDHPAYPADGVTYAYDPALGREILDELGLIDTNEDGIRERTETGERTVVTPISITLGTDDFTPLRHQINEQVQADLLACGVQVSLYELPPQDWYADGPFSPLFGRRFDLGTFAWLSRIEPPCNLYLTKNISGPEEEGFGGWSNVNATGWSNEAFDTACQTAQDSFLNSVEYQTNHQEAIRIFTEELPMMPLFSRVELLLHEPSVTGIQIDATQRLPFWNVSRVDWDDGG